MEDELLELEYAEMYTAFWALETSLNEIQGHLNAITRLLNGEE